MRHRIVRVALSGLLLLLVAGAGLYARSAVSGGRPASLPAAPSAGAAGLAVDPADGTLLRVGGGLFRSGDRGRSWEALPVPDELRPAKLRQVATTSAAPRSLYAAGPGAGIVRSDDRGKTWRAVSDGLPSQEVGAFAVHSFRPDTLYAWIAEQGVFQTEDDGRTWEKMDDGPPAKVVALAHSTLEGSMNTGWIYAATPDGPYLSMDCF